MPATATVIRLEHAVEDSSLGNHRGQNLNLRTAMQYMLTRLLLYFLAALTPENSVRTWDLGFSLSVKLLSAYLSFSNQDIFRPGKH